MIVLSIYIETQSFYLRIVRVFFARYLRVILSRKDFFFQFEVLTFCLEHYYNKKLTFMILLKHILRVRQIMLKNLIIFTKEKFFSANEMI